MIYIEESGMRFGPFDEQEVYHIEKSQIYQELQHKLQMAEFLLMRNNKTVWIVEAKSSSPNPENQASKIQFDEYIENISEKLVNALTLTVSILLNRQGNAINDIPKCFSEGIFTNCSIKMIVVVNGHRNEWMNEIQDAISQQLYTQSKVWRFDIAAINDATAKEINLIA